METLEISVQETPHKYPIWIGNGILKDIAALVQFSKYSKYVVITDDNVARYWLAQLQSALPQKAASIEVPPGEIHKTIEQVQEIWKELHCLGADRKSLIINLGGGVIGDMGGFAASTYMRGVDFLQVPTTLLAQVDASVGGKVGIDFCGVKNLLGAFNQPAGVVIDVATLQTLPQRDFMAGYAEIIKHGLIRDSAYYREVAGERPNGPNPARLIKLIKRSVEIKAAVIETDQREGGLRKILNFGHTLGHAIESYFLDSGVPLLHGEAISIGMVGEAFISMKRGAITGEELSSIERCLITHELPVRAPAPIRQDALTKLIQADKKNFAARVNWSLLSRIGESVFDQELADSEIKAAIAYVLQG